MNDQNGSKSCWRSLKAMHEHYLTFLALSSNMAAPFMLVPARVAIAANESV